MKELKIALDLVIFVSSTRTKPSKMHILNSISMVNACRLLFYEFHTVCTDLRILFFHFIFF